jgi:SAM-dependent methyltransferase
MNAAPPPCWLCGSTDVRLRRPSTLKSDWTAEKVRITDSNYGATTAIYGCAACKYLFCAEAPDVLPLYREMNDDEYERTRPERIMQARKLLRRISRFKKSGSLLDIGAGSGNLVEAASLAGFVAQGVEPSKWLQSKAAGRGCDVVLGVLPHPALRGPYDVITAVDVIEHVNDPIGLFNHIRMLLANDGIGVVVTPDVEAPISRMLGKHWWHYRPAHISYFSRETLLSALNRAGLLPIYMFRPGWYFPASYLFDRVMHYAPTAFKARAPRFLSRFTVTLNLFDSVSVVFRKA